MLKLQVGPGNCILTSLPAHRAFDLGNLRTTLGRKTVFYGMKTSHTYSTKVGLVAEEVPAGLNNAGIYNMKICLQIMSVSPESPFDSNHLNHVNFIITFNVDSQGFLVMYMCVYTHTHTYTHILIIFILNSKKRENMFHAF